MKNIIIILFTIILAVYIGSTFIIGDGGAQASFLNVAEEVGGKAASEITAINGSVAVETED